MACSKFFSGALPELINEVIQYFYDDYRTLHSCILVNRLWCRLAIPLLWKDPFSIKFPKNHHFIEIYLHNLNEDDKTKLNEYGIYNNLFPSDTLFNYPSFIQHLDTHKVCNSIEKWVAAIGTIQNTNLLYSQILNTTKLIFKSLFLIFIENEANLHSFEVRISTHSDVKYFDETFELILQNPNFICNINNFILDLDKTTDDITRFLEFIYSNCKSLSSLYFLFASSRNNYPIIEKNLSQIIKSQGNLKKISFGFNYSPLYHLLLSLKNPNCSNTLNTIIFYCIDFKNMVVLSEVFNHLEVLESIHIVYCYSLDSNFIQQIVNITKPFKLKSLFLDEIDELLEPLIQKASNYLENFGIIDNETQQSLRFIIKYCNKIKYLGPIWPDNQSIYLLFSILENITQNLNYLTIDAFNVAYDNNFSSIVLQNLGQILPFKLEYLSLCLAINTSDLEVFLKNSQNTFIKKLLISNITRGKGQDILPYIKEYIVKKKKVKYLAIVESFNRKNEDLFSLKDQVKEFESYGIQVLNFNDLFISIYDFIKETY
jgi:hypothetical protein